MMSLAYYGLSFNPFDKQMIQEKDRFLSHDMQRWGLTPTLSIRK